MLKDIVEPLLSWYGENKRELPWREQKNPYYIWISEIMLQQTRVEAVRGYYERFVAALPTVQELAACPEQKLLKLWEGLGYYSRVRNMQRAALIIVEKYGGHIPEEKEQLLALPGIGSYTAGAVASIAYDRPVPAVDGNVLRIWARVKADGSDILKQSTRRQAEKELQEIIPAVGAGALNQAFMDLGARVCIPGNPLCKECPLAFACEAYKKGMTNKLPVRKKAAARKTEDHTVLVVRDGDKVAVHKRPEKGLLAGLYELPNLPGKLSDEQIISFLRDRGLDPLYIEKLKPARHIFSHVEWRMDGYLIRVAELVGGTDGDWVFVDTALAEKEYPVPSAFEAYTSYINIRLGKERYERKEYRPEGGNYEAVNNSSTLL